MKEKFLVQCMYDVIKYIAYRTNRTSENDLILKKMYPSFLSRNNMNFALNIYNKCDEVNFPKIVLKN